MARTDMRYIHFTDAENREVLRTPVYSPFKHQMLLVARSFIAKQEVQEKT
jgi:hypothetical protein